jgi:glycosyltransferase involved in cell wall biosynthesis
VPSVCLIVPCYNEERRLDVPAFERFIGAAPDVSICFVNDGSRDRTLAMVSGLQTRNPGRVTIIDLPRRVGKAEAVRQAMVRIHHEQDVDFIGYWDADLATPLDEVRTMCQYAAALPECLMVLGSRVKRLGSSIHRKASRHYLGRVFATFASLTLRLPVYDTQCGAKLVHRSVVPALFGDPFVSRWIFDVEVLARLRNLVGASRLLASTVEAPLTAWRDVSGSNLRVAHMLRAPFDLWRIRRRYNRGTEQAGD